MGAGHIYVSTPQGTTYALEMDANTTVGEIKDKIVEKSQGAGWEPGEPPRKQIILLFSGEPLDDDDQTLDDYGVESDDKIEATFTWQ